MGVGRRRAGVGVRVSALESLEGRRLLAGVAVVVDNDAAELAGYWQVKTARQGYVGANYLEDGNSSKGASTVKWTPSLPNAGRYGVEIRYIAASGNASAVPVEIRTGNEVVRWSLDQRYTGSQWVSLGQYDFNAGSSGAVVLSNAGTSGWVSADAVRFVPLDVTAGPGNVVVSAPARGTLRLNWTDGATGETGYRVERSTTADFASVVGVDLPANSTAYTFTNLADSATYYFRVRSFGPGTLVSAWTTVSGKTAGVPNRLDDVAVVSTSSTSARLTWMDTATDETLIEVQRSTRPDFASVHGFTVAANVTQMHFTGQAEGQAYYYRVRAVNSVGRGNWSAAATLIPQSSSAVRPQAPSGLVVADDPSAAGQLRISWADNSTNETGFVLERSTSESFATSTLISLPANTTSYTDSGLAEWTAYYYRVRAEGSGGASAFSNADWNRTAEDDDFGSATVRPTTEEAAGWTAAPDGSLTDSGTEKGSLSFTFAPPPESQMYYRVEYLWTPGTHLGSAVPLTINSWYPGFTPMNVVVDQKNGSGVMDLGVVYDPIISLGNGDASGAVMLGSIRYTPVRSAEVVDAKPNDLYGSFSALPGSGSFVGGDAYIAPPASSQDYSMTMPLAPKGHYGLYEVYIRYASSSSYSTTANFNIGMQAVSVDQTKEGGKWVRLGVAVFDVDGTSQGISLTSIGSTAPVTLDAVLFRPLAYYL